MSGSEREKSAFRQRGMRRSMFALGGVAALSLIVTGGFLWQRAEDPRTAMATGQFDRAFTLYRLAAKTDPLAKTALGNLYYLGMGTQRDFDAARYWYYRAAASEQTAAMVNLGHLYREGLGIAPDVMRAFAWYHIADRNGDAVAESYMRLIASEWSLSPMMMKTARERWPTLGRLLEDEGHD